MTTLLQRSLRSFASTLGGQFATESPGQLLRIIHAVDVRIADLKDQIDALDRKRIMVAVQIESDQVGRQIADLEKDNRNLTREKESREKDLQRYNQLAEQLDLQANPQSISLFDEQIQTVKNKKNVFTTELKKLAENIYQAKKTRDNLQQEFDDLSNELSVLRAQKNNITGAPARIRAELLEFSGATEQEIPFVGELIKIKSSEAVWESAIERLLHHFALQLIIPDQYYGQVSQYVNQNDLKGRIIYQKFNKKAVAPGIFSSSDPDELITKLEFKASAYTEWVKNEIKRKFNYNCTDDLETFRLSDKALTSAGQTKNAARHEKDDRPEIKNRQFYILGWDNKEKIDVLKEAVTQLNGRISEAEKTITYLQNQETRIRKATENITSFLAFDNYKKIDWWTLSAQIQENTSRIAELQETNDRVKTLKEQMDGLIKSIAALTGELDTAKDELRTLEGNISQQEQKLRGAINTLHNYEGMAVAEQLSRFESQFMQNLEINMETIDGLRSKRQQKLGDDISTLKDRLRELETEAEGLMRAFIQPDRQIIDQFEDWNADTHRLRDRAEFIDEYLATLTRLEEQELVEYKLQFKKYLNEEMITKMSDFQTWLEMQEEEIDGNIETLNGSLEKISFKNNPPTFIQLDSEKDYSPKVKLFKSQLNDWKPNLVEFERTKDDNILEQSFNKIKSTLDYLAQDENMRKEVLDVRNWLKFKAVEHHREDPAKIFRSYTGTAKLSGGESAQLTYTILGSAIAYQFGIHSEGLNTNSFRFICVDEAFSKQDDEKARFLMDLCKQLHLQVMVVSPAKAEEVAIVEPYIARVHFVQRKDNRHSVLYDMPIKQLQEHRGQYLQTTD